MVLTLILHDLDPDRRPLPLHILTQEERVCMAHQTRSAAQGPRV